MDLLTLSLFLYMQEATAEDEIEFDENEEYEQNAENYENGV